LNFLLRAAAFAPLFFGSLSVRLLRAPIVVLLFGCPSLKEGMVGLRFKFF